MPDATTGGRRPGPGGAGEQRPAVRGRHKARRNSASGHLTPRERSVLELIVEGRRNLEIAAALEISERTVKFHVTGLFAKLGVSSRTQLVSLALTKGLLDS